MPVQHETKISAGFGQLLLVKQVMHHEPGFGVVESVARAFVAGRFMLHGEQVGKGEPDLSGEKLGQRLGGVRVALISDEIFLNCRLKLRIGSYFHFSVIETDRAEVFGEALVEPSLSGRIVEVQQADGEIVRNGPPRVFLEGVQDDEILIVAGKQKSGSVDRLALVQGRELVVRPVVLEGEDGERAGLVEAIFREEAGEDRPHLLEAQGDLAAFFFAGVGDDRVMGGVNLEPWRLGSSCDGYIEDEGEEAYREQDGQKSRHGRRAEGFN